LHWAVFANRDTTCPDKKIGRNISNEYFSFVVGKDTCSKGEKQIEEMF
jgi:hypothetical protein|tara:strand:- start:400 stop:543 length:144 start_codon:yes stop_codon:yes gene_type:complete